MTVHYNGMCVVIGCRALAELYILYQTVEKKVYFVVSYTDT